MTLMMEIETKGHGMRARKMVPADEPYLKALEIIETLSGQAPEHLMRFPDWQARLIADALRNATRGTI